MYLGVYILCKKEYASNTFEFFLEIYPKKVIKIEQKTLAIEMFITVPFVTVNIAYNITPEDADQLWLYLLHQNVMSKTQKTIH